MANKTDKKRLSVWLPQNTCDNVHNFVKNNTIVTAKLVPGTVVEIALQLFFDEVSKRPLEDIVSEYLTTGRPGDIEK